MQAWPLRGPCPRTTLTLPKPSLDGRVSTSTPLQIQKLSVLSGSRSGREVIDLVGLSSPTWAGSDVGWMKILHLDLLTTVHPN
jgi:hypothetical protein